MDRQETIKLLDDYMSALNTKKENGNRINKLKMDMGITYDPNDGYSLIRFLWPFLVAFPFLGTFIIVLIAYLTKAEYRSEVYFSYIIGAAIYFTISVVIARLLRKIANKKLYDKRVAEQKKADEKASEIISKLQNEIDEADEFIKNHNDLIPVTCRNIESLKQIKSKIFRGKAESIEEAANN